MHGARRRCGRLINYDSNGERMDGRRVAARCTSLIAFCPVDFSTAKTSSLVSSLLAERASLLIVESKMTAIIIHLESNA